MKRIFCYLLMAAALPLALVGCSKVPQDTDEIDGGVQIDHTDPDAPKSIESTEIISFSCEFSTASMMEEDCPFPRGFYHLNAEKTGDSVTCRYRCRGAEDRDESFTADDAFLKRLHQIVSAYDLAAYNGNSYRVSGLPEMYGASLDVHYASGESIYSYNNQDNYLSVSAMNALRSLFLEAIS